MKLKNAIILVIFCVMFMPFAVNAEEYCTIIKGSGKNIGDEIKCGTENFYIVSSSQEELSLLTKYNLFVGDKIDNITVNEEEHSNSSLSDNDYCMQVGRDNGYNPYYVVPMKDDDMHLKSCRVYEKIEYERVVQDERAVGTKLVGGKSVLPLYGIVYMNTRWGYERIHDNIDYYNDYDENGDLVLSESAFEKYINGYKEELERQKIGVKSVSFITLSKTLKLLKDISGKDVIVELEYPSQSSYEDLVNGNNKDYEFYYGKMDITKYLGEKHKWIYDVTYWLGSGFIGDPNNFQTDSQNDYYISNEGMLCAIGRGECTYLPYPIGNGIRPLVTIPRSSLLYNISTKTDGNGSIEVVKTAAGNEVITFKAASNRGYRLSKLVVTTDSGETVEFNEKDINVDSTGLMSISSNVFTMPYENVTIEASWALDIINPQTGDKFLIFFMIMLLCLGLGMYFSKKKILN